MIGEVVSAAPAAATAPSATFSGSRGGGGSGIELRTGSEIDPGTHRIKLGTGSEIVPETIDAESFDDAIAPLPSSMALSWVKNDAAGLPAEAVQRAGVAELGGIDGAPPVLAHFLEGPPSASK